MPNHVHVLLMVLASFSLSEIVQGIKSVSSHRINKLVAQSGPLWMPDYYDRFIRSDAHFANEVEYIESNPVAAGLCVRPEEWPFGSASWRLRCDPPTMEI